jgi:hypothetical protein
MSVFPRLFWFYRGFGCFSAMGVQKQYKKRFAKQIDQKVETRCFFDFFLITFLGVSR